jgi:hypothetical protein
MSEPAGQCPFLIPVMVDALWMSPTSAYCRRPGAPMRVPGRETLERVCTTPAHAGCGGFREARSAT